MSTIIDIFFFLDSFSIWLLKQTNNYIACQKSFHLFKLFRKTESLLRMNNFKLVILFTPHTKKKQKQKYNNLSYELFYLNKFAFMFLIRICCPLRYNFFFIICSGFCYFRSHEKIGDVQT